jgi:2-aminoadipate transaminase
MRLNFSGSDEDAVREGVRRIGKVVSEQVALYGTLTGRGRAPARAAGASRRPASGEARGAAAAARSGTTELGPAEAGSHAETPAEEDLARVVPMRRRSGRA